MAKRRLVVIGGDAAGMSAAAQARRRDAELEITVFERTPYVSYASCGIPYYLAGLVESKTELIARTPEEFEKQGIQVRASHEVTAIDLEEMTVSYRRLQDGQTTDEGRWPFDVLVIATGSRPVVPNIPGVNATGVFSVGNLYEGEMIARYVVSEHPRRAVVVGTGYVGLEMTEALVRRGLEVTLVGRSQQVMSTLDPEIAVKVTEAVRNLGARVVLGEHLQGLEVDSSGRVREVVTSNSRLPADMVVLGLGVRPNSDLAKAAGLRLGVRESIAVDPYMRTEFENVWAAGDCIQLHHIVTGRPTWGSVATAANKTGRIAGRNLTGDHVTFPGILGTAVTKVGEVEVARTGLNAREAEEAGFRWRAVQVDSLTQSRYYPGTASLTLRLLAEEGSGRLLGAQIVGGQGAAKRIDTVVVALQAGLSVHEVEDLDLSYAPPFAPVWEAVILAARQLAEGA